MYQILSNFFPLHGTNSRSISTWEFYMAWSDFSISANLMAIDGLNLSSPDSYVIMHFLLFSYLLVKDIMSSLKWWNPSSSMNVIHCSRHKRERRVLIRATFGASCSHQSFTSVRIRMCIKRMTTSLEIVLRETIIYLYVFVECTEHALDTSHLLAEGVNEQWSPGRPLGNTYPKQQTPTTDID